ncbi:hypothetical protein P4637_13165 [Halalkalibacterium halodurans]|jgi:hypothetical protein|uniref:BH0437 protein n=2 Tax=Halalkalibacterium halodurans TaxID=86665 RepID=Q9KFP2_HALH5|nr:hypothetical protein [Halalkalibacterium halodurans]MDY7220938.1 hypothetical protein [Halalkalibacterium halodurans]MDY7240177.1 hypothetical protein [Halalkalibacterium halodurans]MED4082516.1 hypothetical protein [Halalkalibacterium halodurans]MED4085761.1 hypothetical protein [Halalkalibacterium halodurans]MED4105627.1 hypothetical protein [Halalkalibacterium halodurans]
MRQEIIYFLEHTTDAAVMKRVIDNLDHKGLWMLIQYLERTNQQTKQKWHEALNAHLRLS